MRDLVTRQLEHLLAHELSDDEALGLIRHHIGGIVLRSLGQMFFDLHEQPVQVLPLARRDRHNACEVVRLCIVCNDGQTLLAWDAVHLVHGE